MASDVEKLTETAQFWLGPLDAKQLDYLAKRDEHVAAQREAELRSSIAAEIEALFTAWADEIEPGRQWLTFPVTPDEIRHKRDTLIALARGGDSRLASHDKHGPFSDVVCHKSHLVDGCGPACADTQAALTALGMFRRTDKEADQ